MAASTSQPADYLSTQNSVLAGTSNLPATSSSEACGKAFTDATNPKDINVVNELGAVKVITKNPDGDVLIKTLKPDGSSFTMAEDGSIIFTTAKREDDHTTGRFDVNSQGSVRFKIGEAFLIEVGNKNNVVGNKEGDSSTSKALSIVVYGNVDISARDGELNARAKNINLIADNELVLKSGSKTQIVSGEGKGGNQPSGNKEAKKDHGGVIELKAGDFITNVQTKRDVSSVNYALTSHEGGQLATEKLSNIGIQIPGSYTVDVQGDMWENILGKRRTSIQGKSDPITTTLPGQSTGWLAQVGPLLNTGEGENTVVPDAFTFTGKNGGFKYYADSGNIDLYTKSGYWGVGNQTSVVAGIDKPVPGYPNAKPGVYLRALREKIQIDSKTQVDIYASSPTTGISITTAKMTLKNPSGIYLN